MHGKTLDLVRVVAVASEEGEERASCGGRRWGWLAAQQFQILMSRKRLDRNKCE